MLIAAFVGILLMTFGVMAFFTAPSQGQKALERRIGDIRSSGTELSATRNELDQLLKVQNIGNFGWLDSLLQDVQFSKKLKARIIQADSKTSVPNLLLTSLGLGVAGFVICYLMVPVLAIPIVVAVGLAYVPYGILSFKRSRRIAKFNNGLPDAIDMMSRALRAGHSMVASLNVIAEQAIAPVGPEFKEVFRQQNYGLPLRDALMQMLENVPSQDLRVLVTGILVQKETGGNLAEILDRTVAVIRERLRIQGEIRTHTAQGRLTGYILCALPIVMLGAINIINPGYSKVLFDTPLGHKIIYVGIGLLVAGGLIIRQIINGIEV